MKRIRITGAPPVAKLLWLATMALAAGCSRDDFNILNNNDPTVEQLTQTPTRATLARAAFGKAPPPANPTSNGVRRCAARPRRSTRSSR